MISFINDNNQSINFTGDFGITKQVAYFRNLQIKGDVSVSFNVPNNSETRDALGYYGYNQVTKPIFSTNQFNLVKNGNVLMRGYLIIEEDTGKELSLYFISGNANWFKDFDFSCKDIRNTGYQLRFIGQDIVNSWTNTRGIIFPVIDYIFQRNKFDNKNFLDALVGVDDEGGAVNILPCLYIHTLVDELGNHAGIKIKGDLLDDKLYRSLIITPETSDIRNEWGLIDKRYSSSQNSSGTGLNTLIRIQDIAPSMKAIEIIKWLIVKFGCEATFDTYSNTLELNIIEKFKREDAEDWSEYFRSYTVKYNQYDKSYIRIKEAPEADIEQYNINNPDALYGELLIDSGKGDGSTTDLYTDPFAPVYDDIGETALLWATPFIEYYKLEDADPANYTAVSSAGGQLIFEGVSTNYDQVINGYLVFRVDDDNGIYTGYHVGGFGTTGQVATSFSDFISTSTGTIYYQKLTKQDAGPRVLVCIPNYPVSSFTSGSTFFQNGFETITNVAYAYYHKPFYNGYFSLNGFKSGLAYSQPDMDIVEVQTPPISGPVTYTVTLAITAELSVPNAAKFYYKINFGSWTLLKSTTVPVYSSYTVLTSDPITAEENDTVSIGVFNSSDVNVTFGLTDAPSNTYTGFCGQDTDTAFVVTQNVTKYVNLKCTAGTPNTFTTC